MTNARIRLSAAPASRILAIGAAYRDTVSAAAMVAFVLLGLGIAATAGAPIRSRRLARGVR